MKIPVFCAGALQVRLPYFVIVIAVARTIRYFGLAFLAVNYGDQTMRFLKTHIWQTALGAVLLAAVFTLGMRLLQKHETKMGHPE